MRKNTFIYIFILLILGSCSTITKVTNSSTNEIKTYESGVVMRPLLADLEVVDSRESIEYIVPDYMSVKKDGKQNALLAFKKAYKCDYVVDPIFEITTKKGRINEVKINLSGYAATYSNIRQVDTLPKSITQYNKLHKPVKDLDYLNSFSDVQPTMGIEFLTLAYNGFQFDKMLKDSNNRFYFGLESYGLGLNTDLTADFYNKDLTSDSIMGSLNEYLMSQNTYSFGLFREFRLTNFLKFRVVGGVNLLIGKVYYDEDDINFLSNYYADNNGLNNYGDEFTCSSLGLRVGAAIDIKIYKSLSAVIKMHYNQGLLNTLFKNDALTFQKFNQTTFSYDDVDNYSIKKVRYDNDSKLNFVTGLRIVF